MNHEGHRKFKGTQKEFLREFHLQAALLHDTIENTETDREIAGSGQPLTI